MKKILITILVLAGSLVAQNSPTVGGLPDSGPTLPATCVVGQIYFKTTSTVGLNQCSAANTWTALGTGSGAGTVSANNGSAGAIANYAAAGGSTTVGPDANLTDSGGVLTTADGLTFSGASGAATTLSTSTTNANLLLAPNGTGAVVFNNGTAANPAFGFAQDTTTGFRSNSVGVMGFSSSGVAHGNFSGSGMSVNSGDFVGWNTGGVDTRITRAAAGTFDLGTTANNNSLGVLQLAKIGKINGASTAGATGVGAIFGQVSLTGQVASITTSTLCATTCPTGQYAINTYLDSTVTCATPGTASIALTLTWTDEIGTKSAITVPLDVNGGLTLGATMALGNTTNSANGETSIWSVTGNAIQYATTYVACTSGTGTYAIRLVAQQIQ